MVYFPWLDDVVARGIRLDGDRLAPRRARLGRSRVRDGEMLVSDGPFAETKEVICGYDVLECDSLEEAVAVASAHPVGGVRQDRGQGRSGSDLRGRRVHGPAQGLDRRSRPGRSAPRWSAGPATGRSPGPGPGWCR